MLLAYVLDYRFARTPDGVVWSDTLYDASFWSRYLTIFDRVRLIARVQQVREAEPHWVRVDSDQVHVHAVPFYHGPFQYVRRRGAITRAVEEALHDVRAVLLRVPSQLSTCAAGVLQNSGKPFGVEVVGDPSDSF